MTVRIERCATREIADFRKGMFQEWGFEVTLVRESFAVTNNANSNDDTSEEEFLFEGELCSHLLVAIKS